MLNREKEGLANAEVEVVSSEIPTADIASGDSTSSRLPLD
jgi:hypothetical protein